MKIIANNYYYSVGGNNKNNNNSINKFNQQEQDKARDTTRYNTLMRPKIIQYDTTTGPVLLRQLSQNKYY